MIRAAIALILAAGPALASPPQCADHRELRRVLAANYHETPRAMGVAADRTLMELYTSEAGTWTLIVALPTGIACLVAAGTGFEPLSPPPLGEPG